MICSFRISEGVLQPTIYSNTCQDVYASPELFAALQALPLAELMHADHIFSSTIGEKYQIIPLVQHGDQQVIAEWEDVHLSVDVPVVDVCKLGGADGSF